MPADSEGSVARVGGVTVPSPPLADDDGQISPALRSALTATSAATLAGSGESVLAALVGARLFVPVVAIADQVETTGQGLTHDKRSTMASVSMRDESGRRSFLAFTSVDELAQFDTEARPVPVAGPQAAGAALAEGAHAMVVDVRGEAPFALVRGELEVLAAAARGGAQNLGLRSALSRHVADEPHIVNAYLDPAGGSDTESSDAGCELVLVLPPTLTREEYQALVARLSQRLATDRAVIAATTPDPSASHRQGLTIRVVAADDQNFTRQPHDTPSLR